MLLKKIIETAAAGEVEKIDLEIKTGIAKSIKKAIKLATKNMDFKAAKTLQEYLSSLGVKVPGKKKKEVDLKKFSAKLKVVIDGDNMLTDLIIGTINRVGHVTGMERKDGKQVVFCSVKPSDAKMLMEKTADTKEVKVEGVGGSKS